MFEKWRKQYSTYNDQKNKRHRTRWVILWAALFFALYILLNSLVFSMGVLENETMRPGLAAGDRFIFSSFRIYSLFPWPEVERLPFRRGSVVLVDRPFTERGGLFQGALDVVVRFFTAQRVSLGGEGDRLYLKRVIGLPGDEVSMTNFVVRVKPRGASYSFTEFELWDRPYEIIIPQAPALWDETLPFSGNMDTVILGDGECFVLSDDRSNTNDSRTWGPVPLRFVNGKALFRYWPLNRLGRP